MLLVTTADEATWGRDEEILFLGAWCVKAGREATLEGRRHRILPYHWDDRDKLARDAMMLSERRETILPKLAERLNAIHGTSHDLRYWRLVAGPWLMWMLMIVWERRENILASIVAGATESIVHDDAALPSARYEVTSALAVGSDEWNHALCARLLEEFPAVRRRKSGRSRAKNEVAVRPKPAWKQAIKAIPRMLARAIPQPVAFVSLHVPPPTQARMMLGQRQLPLFIYPPEAASFPRDDAMRSKLMFDCGDDAFGRVLLPVLRDAFPDMLLEGYCASRRKALASFPRKPRAILTANAQYDEMFALWAAELRPKAPLVILQHGGHYGVDRIEMMEDHELSVADSYCSWGWKRRGFKNIEPMPALKLQCVLQTPSANERRGLVAVYDAAHRYPNRIYSVPIAGQRRADNAGQLRLLDGLPDHIQAELRLRCHPYDDGYGFRQLLQARGLGDRFDRTGDMVSAIKSARLCLIGSNSTPLMEALTSGTPTLAFYDPRFSEERDEAKEFFYILRQAQIVHDDPAACAAKITEIWDDPDRWWSSGAVIAARQAFMGRFGLTAGDWSAHWAQFLHRLSGCAGDAATG